MEKKLIPDGPSPLEEEFQHEFTELIDQYKKDFLTHGWSAGELAKWCKEMVDKELRESEDERIRECICMALTDVDEQRFKDFGTTLKDCLSWLEKQKINTEGDFGRGYDCGYEACLNSHGAEWFEKQKEQKPNIELIQRSWYMEGYNDRKFGNEPKWIIKTGKGGPKYELNPKYGQSLADEQKPTSTEDMPYITDEHFYEREPADSFKYKLAEYMTKCCTKKEGPYGYEYGISAESILKMAEEELLKRGVVQKPAEWNANDKAFIKDCARILDENGYAASAERLLSMFPVKSAEWSEEDEKMLNDCIMALSNWRDAVANYGHEVAPCQELIDWLKSLRPQPSWKPSEEQLNALNFAITYFMHETNYKNPTELRELYEQLKKL